MPRRRCLALSAGAILAPSLSLRAGDTEVAIGKFMKKFGVPGFSFAIAREGQVVRREAHGLANLEEKEVLDVSHRFRVASVSKPITAVAIFGLIERGKLDLENLVFGGEGVLGRDGPEGITVRHLLTHTSGAWKNDATDPMFKEIDLDHGELIAWTLGKLPPRHSPGKRYAYSNFGYCLLGRVIEKVSGKGYEEFVRENVLEKAGAGGMTVGEGEREVEYYMRGEPVTFKMNIARMDAHGGWVGTPTELVNFAVHTDRFPEPPDLLGEESIATMTERGGVNENYACGWSVNGVGNWWHGGSLPGLSSLLVRTADGHCWAACANTRAKGIGLALDRLMWEIVRGVKS